MCKYERLYPADCRSFYLKSVMLWSIRSLVCVYIWAPVYRKILKIQKLNFGLEKTMVTKVTNGFKFICKPKIFLQLEPGIEELQVSYDVTLRLMKTVILVDIIQLYVVVLSRTCPLPSLKFFLVCKVSHLFIFPSNRLLFCVFNISSGSSVQSGLLETSLSFTSLYRRHENVNSNVCHAVLHCQKL